MRWTACRWSWAPPRRWSSAPWRPTSAPMRLSWPPCRPSWRRYRPSSPWRRSWTPWRRLWTPSRSPRPWWRARSRPPRSSTGPGRRRRADRRQRRLEPGGVGRLDAAQCLVDVRGAGIDEAHLLRGGHHHAHLSRDPLDALLVRQPSDTGAQKLILGLQGRGALERAPDSGVELEDLHLHGHDARQQDPEQRDPGATANDAVEQGVVGQRADVGRRASAPWGLGASPARARARRASAGRRARGRVDRGRARRGCPGRRARHAPEGPRRDLPAHLGAMPGAACGGGARRTVRT